MVERGDYMAQPELDPTEVEVMGTRYNAIDRVFIAFTGARPEFIGGFRSLMPAHSKEAEKGRNHGSTMTVWQEIATS
jgi:hypothetical protein